MASRRELIQAVRARYHAGARDEKKKMLDEFIEVTGFQRKHAIRVLFSRLPDYLVIDPRSRAWRFVLFLAAFPLLPALVAAMERHGHLQLDAEVRRRLLRMSAATMDRLLRPVRETGKQARRPSGINTPLRNSIAVRTFGDWHDPPPEPNVPWDRGCSAT